MADVVYEAAHDPEAAAARRRRATTLVAIYGLLALFAFIYLVPLLVVVFNSFRSLPEILQNGLIAQSPLRSGVIDSGPELPGEPERRHDARDVGVEAGNHGRPACAEQRTRTQHGVEKFSVGHRHRDWKSAAARRAEPCDRSSDVTDHLSYLM